MATNTTDTFPSPSPLPSGAGPRAAEPAEVRAERERGDREALGLVREALVGLPSAAVLRPIEFVRREPRPTPLASRTTDEEAAAHAAFIEKIGANALWLKVS